MHIFCIILLEPEVSQGGFLPLSRMSRQSIEFPPYLVKARASTQFPVSSWPLFTFRFPLPFAMVPPSSFNLFNAFQCFSTMSCASPNSLNCLRPPQSGRRKILFYGQTSKTTLEWQTTPRQLQTSEITVMIVMVLLANLSIHLLW